MRYITSLNSLPKTSDGIMQGCLGAIDGWLVCIRCPTRKEVKNPGKYFARKGFYALNVQVISDMNKKVIWRSIGQIGSIHDSRAFSMTYLYTYLVECASAFMSKGLYFVGDSAYALRSFLLTPYDNPKYPSKEDTFNYFLSRNRIYVECLFGEICRRWGIFWRPLEGSIDRHMHTIDAALKLHNYIVDYRLHKINVNDSTMNEDFQLETTRNEHRENYPGEIDGMVQEEALLQTRVGRPTTEDAYLREQGIRIRDNIRDSLWNAGLRRPQIT